MQVAALLVVGLSPVGGNAIGIALRSLIVVGMTLFRWTVAASESVPVFTFQNSTPHVGLCTVSVIGTSRLRPCPSLTCAVRYFAPVAIAAPIGAETENTLSPGVWSPWVPSSKNCWEAEPPIAV